MRWNRSAWSGPQEGPHPGDFVSVCEMDSERVVLEGRLLKAYLTLTKTGDTMTVIELK